MTYPKIFFIPLFSLLMFSTTLLASEHDKKVDRKSIPIRKIASEKDKRDSSLLHSFIDKHPGLEHIPSSKVVLSEYMMRVACRRRLMLFVTDKEAKKGCLCLRRLKFNTDFAKISKLSASWCEKGTASEEEQQEFLKSLNLPERKDAGIEWDEDGYAEIKHGEAYKSRKEKDDENTCFKGISTPSAIKIVQDVRFLTTNINLVPPEIRQKALEEAIEEIIKDELAHDGDHPIDEEAIRKALVALAISEIKNSSLVGQKNLAIVLKKLAAEKNYQRGITDQDKKSYSLQNGITEENVDQALGNEIAHIGYYFDSLAELDIQYNPELAKDSDDDFNLFNGFIFPPPNLIYNSLLNDLTKEALTMFFGQGNADKLLDKDRKTAFAIGSTIFLPPKNIPGKGLAINLMKRALYERQVKNNLELYNQIVQEIVDQVSELGYITGAKGSFRIFWESLFGDETKYQTEAESLNKAIESNSVMLGHQIKVLEQLGIQEWAVKELRQKHMEVEKALGQSLETMRSKIEAAFWSPLVAVVVPIAMYAGTAIGSHVIIKGALGKGFLMKQTANAALLGLGFGIGLPTIKAAAVTLFTDNEKGFWCNLANEFFERGGLVGALQITAFISTIPPAIGGLALGGGALGFSPPLVYAAGGKIIGLGFAGWMAKAAGEEFAVCYNHFMEGIEHAKTGKDDEFVRFHSREAWNSCVDAAGSTAFAIGAARAFGQNPNSETIRKQAETQFRTEMGRAPKKLSMRDYLKLARIRYNIGRKIRAEAKEARKAERKKLQQAVKSDFKKEMGRAPGKNPVRDKFKLALLRYRRIKLEYQKMIDAAKEAKKKAEVEAKSEEKVETKEKLEVETKTEEKVETREKAGEEAAKEMVEKDSSEEIVDKMLELEKEHKTLRKRKHLLEDKLMREKVHKRRLERRNKTEDLEEISQVEERIRKLQHEIESLENRMVEINEIYPDKVDATILQHYIENPKEFCPDPVTERLSFETIDGASGHFANLESARNAPAEAEIAIIKDLVFYNRLRYPDLRPETLQGWCGTASADVYYRVQRMFPNAGIKVYTHQAKVTFGEGATHGFAVLEFPSGRRYIFDTTINQFFQPTRLKTVFPHRGITRVGLHMRSQPNGNAIADQLIKEGFIELRPEVGKIYGQSMRQGRMSGNKPVTEKIEVDTFLQETQVRKEIKYDLDAKEYIEIIHNRDIIDMKQWVEMEFEMLQSLR